MKTFNRIIVHVLFFSLLILSHSAATYAGNTSEESSISDAIKLYAQALPLEINSPQRAELLTQAESILKKLIEENPKSLEAHRKLVGVYLLQQDYNNGIRTMQSAITLSPEDPKLFISLAFLYEHSGALEYAKVMLDQALELDPHQTLAQEYLATIQQKIDSRNIEQAHAGQTLMGIGHANSAEGAHHSITLEK